MHAAPSNQLMPRTPAAYKCGCTQILKPLVYVCALAVCCVVEVTLAKSCCTCQPMQIQTAAGKYRRRLQLEAAARRGRLQVDLAQTAAGKAMMSPGVAESAHLSFFICESRAV
jgi:hypothetical protein